MENPTITIARGLLADEGLPPWPQAVEREYGQLLLDPTMATDAIEAALANRELSDAARGVLADCILGGTMAYKDHGRTDEALVLAEASVRLARAASDKLWLARSLQRANTFLHELGRDTDRMKVALERAEAWTAVEEHDKSRRAMLEAHALATLNGDHNLAYDLWPIAWGAAMQLGDESAMRTLGMLAVGQLAGTYTDSGGMAHAVWRDGDGFNVDGQRVYNVPRWIASQSINWTSPELEEWARETAAYHLGNPSEEPIYARDHHVFVVDVSNVVRWRSGNSGMARLRDLDLVIAELKRLWPGCTVRALADASLTHRIAEADPDEAQRYEAMLASGTVVQTPAGTKADTFIIREADLLHGLMVTNDLFNKEGEKELAPDTVVPERFVKFHFVGDTVMLDTKLPPTG